MDRLWILMMLTLIGTSFNIPLSQISISYSQLHASEFNDDGSVIKVHLKTLNIERCPVVFRSERVEDRRETLKNFDLRLGEYMMLSKKYIELLRVL